MLLQSAEREREAHRHKHTNTQIDLRLDLCLFPAHALFKHFRHLALHLCQALFTLCLQAKKASHTINAWLFKCARTCGEVESQTHRHAPAEHQAVT